MTTPLAPAGAAQAARPAEVAGVVPSRRGAALAAAAGVLLIWCVAFIAIRVGVSGLSVGSLVLLRFLIASTTLAVAAAIFGAARPRICRDTLRALLLLAITGVVAYNLLLAAGQSLVTAASAAVLINTVPLWTTLLAGPMLNERSGQRAWLGLLVAFGGAAIVATGGPAHLGIGPGVLFVLAAALSQGLYFVLVKRHASRHGVLSITAGTIWIGTACLLPLAPRLVSELGTAPPSAILAAVYLGVVSTAATFLWAFALVHLRTVEAMTLLFLIPPMTAAAEWTLLGQAPAASLLFGGAVTLSGVALASRRSSREAAASSLRPAPQGCHR